MSIIVIGNCIVLCYEEQNVLVYLFLCKNDKKQFLVVFNVLYGQDYCFKCYLVELLLVYFVEIDNVGICIFVGWFEKGRFYFFILIGQLFVFKFYF